VFLRMVWNFISSLPVKRGGSISFLTIFTLAVPELLDLITLDSKVKIVKNERDPPLFTGKLLIKIQNILRNSTQVIIRHRVKILFSVISSDMTENMIFTLCRMITWVVFLRMFWNFISSLPVKRGGSLSFLTIFTFIFGRNNQ
jgi:hypothetical protein